MGIVKGDQTVQDFTVIVLLPFKYLLLLAGAVDPGLGGERQLFDQGFRITEPEARPEMRLILLFKVLIIEILPVFTAFYLLYRHRAGM